MQQNACLHADNVACVVVIPCVFAMLWQHVSQRRQHVSQRRQRVSQRRQRVSQRRQHVSQRRQQVLSLAVPSSQAKSCALNRLSWLGRSGRMIVDKLPETL